MALRPGFVKWCIGPLAAIAVGFFVLGPYLSHSPKMQKIVREKAAQFVPAATTMTPPDNVGDGSTPPESASEKPSGETPAPDVSVKVKPLPDDDAPVRRHRRDEP